MKDINELFPLLAIWFFLSCLVMYLSVCFKMKNLFYLSGLSFIFAVATSAIVIVEFIRHKNFPDNFS
jgi:hypothetical protein